jgi:DNA-binding winged helix-turn-helix (wHTH) protein
MPASAPAETFRFTDFELDVAAYQLRRRGRVVRLERQPMDVLILLVERRRQLVSRADIVERLWGKDVFVDVDTGVHTAIRKIRQALGDSISAPAFVETVPSKGYRFVADVEVPPVRQTRAWPSRSWNLRRRRDACRRTTSRQENSMVANRSRTRLRHRRLRPAPTRLRRRKGGRRIRQVF